MKTNLLLFSAVALLSANAVLAQSSSNLPNRQAYDAMSKGEFTRAISILDEDISAEKNVLPSLKLRSQIKTMTGDFAGAFADVSRSIEITPEDGSLYERRAGIRRSLRQDMKDIVADLDKAISFGAKHERIFSQRGTARVSIGDYEGAISDLRTAIGMRPNNAGAYVALSGVYRRQNDEENAIKVLEEFIAGIENSSNPPKPVEGTATVITGVELPKEKGSDLKTGQESVVIIGKTNVSGPPSPDQMRAMTDRMEQSKNTALAYFILADLYERKDRLPRAADLVAKGMEYDPQDYYAFDVRGRIKIKNGDLNGGINDLSVAIAAFPPNAGPYLERGIAYLLLGKDAEAQADFDRYLQLVPKGKATLEKRISDAKASKQ